MKQTKNKNVLVAILLIVTVISSMANVCQSIQVSQDKQTLKGLVNDYKILYNEYNSLVNDYNQLLMKSSESGINGEFKLNENVYISKNGQLIAQGHNLVTDAGLNHLKAFLGVGSAGSANSTFIAVGNGSAPVAASTTLNSEIAESGFERAVSTYTSTGTGAWKLEKIYTATGTVNSINSTALFNATSGGTMFAGNTFSSANFIANDILNVTWTVAITNP